MNEKERRTSRDQPLPTRIGHAGWDDHRFRGFSVYDELMGKTSLTQLVGLAITQRCFDEAECAFFDEVACVMMVCDPRIYPFKMTRLTAAASGNLFLAHAVGNLVQTGELIGYRVCQKAAANLERLMDDLGDRYDDLDAVRPALERMLENLPFFHGFGLPIRPADERFVALEKVVVKHNRHTLPHWRLMQRCKDILTGQKIPNIIIGLSAVCLDIGMTPAQCSALGSFVVQPAFIANALEGSLAREETLKQLPQCDVCYVGTPPRTSPRAHRSRSG